MHSSTKKRLQVRSVKGLKICFRESRRGSTAVLLIHGNSSSGLIFQKQIRDLDRAGFSVVVPDLPGHGHSGDASMPSRTYSFPGYAEVLAGLMAGLGYCEVHVVGWSLGGHVGLELLSRYRQVRSLLVTGTPPVSLDRNSIAAGFRWTPVTALAGRRFFRNGDVRRYVGAMLGTRRPSDEHLDAAARTDGRARFWMVANGVAGVGVDGRRVAETSRKPLAVVQGLQDPFVRAEYVTQIDYKNIWKSAPIFLKAGHAPHWEIPGEFNDRMIGFLDHARGPSTEPR